MREISHHVLDIIYNSVEAGARRVEIRVVEDSKADSLTISVADDGRGMDPEVVARALDPFFTSRTTRDVGLGLSLLEASARACAGEVKVDSRRGEGTTVTACFQRSHVDRQPLGDMASTLMVAIVGAPAVDLCYRHEVDGRVFAFDTSALRAELEGLPLSHPAVVRWLRTFLEEGLHSLQEAREISNVEMLGRSSV